MAEHGLSVILSPDYEAKLITQERLTVDPAKFRRAVTNREFLEAAAISINAAREILDDRKLRKMSKVAESVQLRIMARARRPAAMPENITPHEART